MGDNLIVLAYKILPENCESEGSLKKVYQADGPFGRTDFFFGKRLFLRFYSLPADPMVKNDRFLVQNVSRLFPPYSTFDSILQLD